MNQQTDHFDAITKDYNNIHHQVQVQKEKYEQMKQETMALQVQLQQITNEIQINALEAGKSSKINERLQTLLTQYLPLVPPEHQMKLQAELENSRQPPQVAQNMGMMHGMPSHMQQAMMMAQAQAAQAQAAQVAASRNPMIPGINSPASRLSKQNGMPNGAVPGMPPGMQNGMNLAAMNQMSQMMGMPNMAQLQAMVTYSQMGAMGGIPGMPGFNPAQLAAMQGMGMMPPMSVPGMNQNLSQQMPSHMNLSINTPSRNTNSNGPVSGSRTPQSVASPRQPKVEGTSTPTAATDDKRISPAGDDTVAVA